MNSRFDLARHHKLLSLCCFGGGTLALLVITGLSFNRGNTLLGLGFGATFLVVGVLTALYLLELFVWEPRRGAERALERMKEFRTAEDHREERARQQQRRHQG